MRTASPLAVSIIVGLFALLVDGPARANIQSPPEEACSGKKVDDACTLPSGESGACKADKCNQLDYSQGTPPKSVEVDCVVCIAGGQAGQPPGPGPVAVDDGDGAADSAPAEPAEGGTPLASDPTPEPPSSDSRCSVSAKPGGVGGITLALLAGLALRRRRGA